MEQVLLVVHVMIAAALIGMVLLQRSETDGFGLSGGSGSNLLSGRSAANLMTRITAILATLFIANSLILSIMAAQHNSRSIVDTIEQEQQVAPAGVTKEVAPAAAEKATAEETPAAKVEKKPAAPAVPDADVAPKPVKKAVSKAPAAAPKPAEGKGEAGATQEQE